MTPWALLAAMFAAGAMLAWPLATDWLDWQAEMLVAEPWRAFSAAFVHWSVGHLLANLAGCAVLAWLGLAASLPARCTRAWLLAWPLTHVGLLLLPDLQHYGGLSGVLHAGVAIAVVELLFRQGRDRLLGAAIAAGLLLKLLLEQPFGAAMRQVPGWDIAVVPFAHLSGAIAGLACALLLSINWQGRSVNQ